MASSEKVIEQLLQLSQLPNGGTRGDVVARALRTAILLLDGDAAVAVLGSARDKGERLALYAGSETPAALPSIVETSEALRMLAGERQALAVPDLSEQPVLGPADACPGVEAGPVLFAPLDQKGGSLAYLAVYRKRGRAKYTANETEHMLLLAAWLGASLEVLRLTAGAERMILTDEGTQVYNTRFIKTALRREVSRAERHGLELSIIRIEVDGLDTIRETYGRAHATRILQELAFVLVRQVRTIDLVGKNGEGFLAILPQTSRDDAAEVAERMRAAVEAARLADTEPGSVTVTLGAAGFPEDSHDANAVIAVAERALEQGRQKGGNCVGTPLRKAA